MPNEIEILQSRNRELSEKIEELEKTGNKLLTDKEIKELLEEVVSEVERKVADSIKGDFFE
jgi:hypothetical protein